LLLAFVAILVAGCASTTASRNAGHVFRDCSDCPELVVVTPGAGAPAGMPAAVAVGRYEVTRDEFAAFESDDGGVAPLPCYFRFVPGTYLKTEGLTRQHPGFDGYRPSGRDPIVCVSWSDAEAYVEWLSRKTGQQYRLPSAQEAAYFARGNVATRYAWGDRTEDACLYANGLDRTAAAQEWATHPIPDLQYWLPTGAGIVNCEDGYAYTAPVGSFRANLFGLYDTTGNAWEWTADCITDQKLLPEGSYYPLCIARGGGWQSNPVELSNHGQRKLYASAHPEDAGFRVIRIISE
jgi:formylglycine-generating enzyme required for sulfatase activity